MKKSILYFSLLFLIQTSINCSWKCWNARFEEGDRDIDTLQYLVNWYIREQSPEQFEEIKSLIAKTGPNVYVVDNYGCDEIPFIKAVLNSRNDIVKLFLDAKVDINQLHGYFGNDCKSALHTAVMKGHVETTKLLIEAGADFMILTERPSRIRDIDMSIFDIIKLNPCPHEIPTKRLEQTKRLQQIDLYLNPCKLSILDRIILGLPNFPRPLAILIGKYIFGENLVK